MNNLLDKYRSFLEGTSRASSSSGIGSELRRSSEPSKLSPSTIRNYLSDTRHFLTFLTKYLNKTGLQATDITPKAVKVYGSELRRSSEPSQASSKRINKERFLVYSSQPSLATTNRRLSSLRRFGHFLHVTKQLPTDPTANLTNPKNQPKSTTIRQILNQYQTYLKAQALTESTIKNYLSDLNSYLLWAKQNHQNIDNGIFTRQT